MTIHVHIGKYNIIISSVCISTFSGISKKEKIPDLPSDENLTEIFCQKGNFFPFLDSFTFFQTKICHIEKFVVGIILSFDLTKICQQSSNDD